MAVVTQPTVQSASDSSTQAVAPRRSPRRGADLRYDLTIEFEEAIAGVEKEIEITRQEVCSTCKGSGAEPGTTPVRSASCTRAARSLSTSAFVEVALPSSRIPAYSKVLT